MGDKYIVNPGGLVSSVTEEQFAELIVSKPDFEGRTWREASDEEAAECAARENPKPADESAKGKSPKGDK